MGGTLDDSGVGAPTDTVGGGGVIPLRGNDTAEGGADTAGRAGVVPLPTANPAGSSTDTVGADGILPLRGNDTAEGGADTAGRAGFPMSRALLPINLGEAALGLAQQVRVSLSTYSFN